MNTRIEIPGLTNDKFRSLSKEVKQLLGLHRSALHEIEIRSLDYAHARRPGQWLCEVTVRFRQGGYFSIQEEESNIGRALLRVAWRVEQRREFGLRRTLQTPWERAPAV